MGISANIPIKTYILNFIVGLILFLISVIALNSLITKNQSLIENFKQFWILIVFYVSLAIYGYVKADRASREWNKIEELEINKILLENEKLSLGNKKLNLEIQKLKRKN